MKTKEIPMTEKQNGREGETDERRKRWNGGSKWKQIWLLSKRNWVKTAVRYQLMKKI